MSIRNLYLRVRFISLLVTMGILISCFSKEKLGHNTIVVLKTTNLYDPSGKVTFTHYLKVWYKDSLSIQELRGVSRVTDTANVTTITYPILSYRYIDLKKKVLYDYKSFSDTARIINKAILPDSLMDDMGWSFYSEKAYKVQDIPMTIADTTIGNIVYKRIKFNYVWDDPQKEYSIGHIQCNGKGNIFSLEKDYCKKIDCPMVSVYNYLLPANKLFGLIEISYLGDSLSSEELKIFEAWEKNAKDHPVNK